MTYEQFVNRLAYLMKTEQDDFNYMSAIPATIDSAEQRIYRDLNLLTTVKRDSTSNLTADTRTFTLPSTTSWKFITVQEINVVTPSSLTLSSSAAVRNPLISTSRKFIDYAAPMEGATSTSAVPTLYSMLSDTQTLIGPAPGAAYNVEVVGTFRPTALSSANNTTYLSLYLPDLFLAASMLFMSRYMDGAAAQQSEAVWSAEYQKLLGSADREQTRAQYNEAYNAGKTFKVPTPESVTP